MRGKKRAEETRRLLEDYCRELGPEYHIGGDPTSVWADIYRDIDDCHDIEVANYTLGRRSGTEAVQVNLWFLSHSGEHRVLVTVKEVPNDVAIVRMVSDRLARLAEDENSDNTCIECIYGQLDEAL